MIVHVISVLTKTLSPLGLCGLNIMDIFFLVFLFLSLMLIIMHLDLILDVDVCGYPLDTVWHFLGGHIISPVTCLMLGQSVSHVSERFRYNEEKKSKKKTKCQD